MFVVSTRNFPPDIGGMQNLMGGLSLSLLKYGPVKVFAEKNINENNFDKNLAIDLTRVSGFKILRKYRKANLIKEFALKNSVRAFFFDHWKSIEKIDDKILSNTPSFCLIHSKEINHDKGSFINKRMIKSLNKADHVIANSNFTKNLALKLGVNPINLSIIHPGCNYPIDISIDAKKYAKGIYKDSFPKLITISRLDGRKSHQNILMTIKNLLPKFPNLKYVSIGTGEQKANLIKLKKELNLNKEVEFIYTTNEQQKVALLDQSDLFVMPSILYKKSVEGFGISYIEAAAYGKASIGGIFGGESDAIVKGKTGYLCDGGNLNDLYDVLSKSLENENYKKLGKNALVFSKDFNWKIIIKKYIILI